jgi:nucleoside-diphosphate-sugar epimerase
MSRPHDPERFPSQIDAVVHLAQSRRYREFPEGTDDLIRVNVVAPIALLKWAAKQGVQRFCLVSTGSVYEPYDGPLNEAAALAPQSMHASSKLACELLTRPFERQLSISRLRLFFPYGPGQSDRLVPDLIHRIQTGRAIELNGSEGGLEFCPTFVGDIAAVISCAVEDRWTGTFNIASAHVTTLKAFSELLGQALGRAPVFHREPLQPPLRIVPSLELLRQKYRLDSMVLPADGVAKTVAWYANAKRSTSPT